MRSEKEILDALKVLQDVCTENCGRCSDCILRNGNDNCGVLEDTSGDSYTDLRDWCLKEEDKPRIILG